MSSMPRGRVHTPSARKQPSGSALTSTNMQMFPSLHYVVPRWGRVRASEGKSAEYTELMQEKMQWDPNAPYKYDFGRGLYYHHILDDELLCGSQPTGPNDIKYLAQAEKVKTVVSV
jgi:hypothetical protein